MLNSTFSAAYFQNLGLFLERELISYDIFPAMDQIFTAFQRCSLQQTKVVIIGQDPYHGLGQAQGLSFSVPPSFPLPPSLRNIYKELYEDTVTLCHSHHMKLHSIYGKRPKLIHAEKQKRWVEKQRDKYGMV